MENSLIDLLEPSATLLNITCDDNLAVIETLSDHLHAAGIVKDSYKSAVIEREKSMPTGLPLDGPINVAIPHADIEHVNEARLALATLTQPVTFQNMVEPETSIPVQIVILMALKEAKAQVEMLMAIAEVLQTPSVIQQILEASTYDEVVRALKRATESEVSSSR